MNVEKSFRGLAWSVFQNLFVVNSYITEIFRENNRLLGQCSNRSPPPIRSTKGILRTRWRHM